MFNVEIHPGDYPVSTAAGARVAHFLPHTHPGVYCGLRREAATRPDAQRGGGGGGLG